MFDEKLENNAGLRETVELSKEQKDSQRRSCWECLINFGVGDSEHGPQLHRIKLLIVSRAGDSPTNSASQLKLLFRTRNKKTHLSDFLIYHKGTSGS